MGREDATFVFAGAYESEVDAQLDYEAIKELHAAGVIGGYDAAVIRKGDDGKVHVNKDETSTRKGAWGGAVVGAVVGILFPPSIIAGAAIGALAGGVGGHIFKGMSRSDMKDLGELLDEGQAGLLVVGDWQLEEAVDKAFAHAERTIEREIKGLERAEIEAEYAKVMSGQ
jgi:uncharacterized membrane protein